ncbi:MAG TPA: elongation factor G [Clostridia bacterium]|nr:elongation factor G [Clostridia bacterium]
MRQFKTGEIRNVVLLGHSGKGKTALAESMLFLAGATDRLGRVEDGNTVCDFDPEEVKRRVSVSAKIAPLEWKGCKINIIDTPGLFDFEGEALEGLRAGDCALITISAKSGVGVGAEKAWKRAGDSNLPRAFYISKIDEERADFYKVFEDLKNHFGTSVCPVIVPFGDNGNKVYVNLIEQSAFTYDGKGKASPCPMPEDDTLGELITALNEAVAETDEELLDKYYSGEAFTKEELGRGVHKGLTEGVISPVFCGSSVRLAAIDLLLDSIAGIFPSGSDNHHETFTGADGKEVKAAVSETEPLAAVVFKTLADPYVGKLSFFKVISGRLNAESTVVNARTGQPEKVGKLYMLRGKKQTEVEAVAAGDIGAVSKMLSPLTGDTLCSPQRVVNLKGITFPEPCLSMAVAPKTKGDEDKISQGLHRLMEEDQTFRFINNTETKQQVISGLGEQHLDVIVSKLKTKFGVSVNLEKPKVAYRETIRKKVKVQGRHKKQTGGHGQFGDVWIEFEPCEREELVFEERVFGGAVPRNFFPAVEKGLRECVVHGVLAGYPVVNLKATLVDGSYHPVDSSEMSFKVAATLAYRAGLAQANPVILEPIGLLTVTVPESNMGDVIGEVNKVRGRVLGMNGNEEGMEVIEAEAPMAEMHDFSTVLRSITQGRGYFTFKFARYEEAPPQVAQNVIANSKHVMEAIE